MDTAIVHIGGDREHFEFMELYRWEHEKSHKLNRKTLKSIAKYTSNSKDKSGEFNHILINRVIEKAINENQRISPFSKEVERDAYLINKALKNSFATSARFVYKGIKRQREFDILVDLKESEVFSFKNFTSTSYSDASAQTHAKMGIIVKISNAWGIPVDNNQEIEFLLPAQSEFKVLAISNETWGSDETVWEKFSVFHVEQIAH